MARDHVIAPGDHVVRLAYTHGHATIDAVWQHPANAELRQRRPDPAVLAEGDVVHVPDAPARSFEGMSTRREHTLVVALPFGDPYAARSAIEEFQCDHGLVVDGVMGPKTHAALLRAHGA